MGQVTGGERPLRLARMGPVCFQVEQVIQQVDRGGTQAERHEGRQSRENGRVVVGAMGGKQRHDDEYVLGPLVGTQRTDHRPSMGGVATERTARRCEARGLTFQLRASLHDNGATRALPYQQVAALVSAVIETAFTEALDELGGLGRAGQVDIPIAGQNAVENTQVRRNTVREAPVGCCAQPEALAPPPALLAAISKTPGCRAGPRG